MAPPILLPSDPRAIGGRVSGVGTVAEDGADAEPGWVLAVCALRARMRLICRSRRTMTLVIWTGQTPAGNTVCLHMGHSEE
jgi:hypothetical protein